jgi:hypothetical protein
MLSNSVLFSCVGNTDPIRDNFDGPLLHIIRYYKPHKAYIFFSKEMGEREKKDMRYSRSVEMLAEHLGISVEIEKIFSDIKDPHNFDAYIDIFGYIIKKIRKDHPDDTLLLNISSGTPQMEATLCLETVVAEGKVIPVQVATPARSSNRSRPVGEDYNIELEFQNNLDNEPESENRCSEPDIISFKKTLLEAQIKALVNSYNYSAAKTILTNFYPFAKERVMKLIQHCIYRFELKTNLAEEVVAGIKDINFYPVKHKECMKVCEYINILDIYQKTGDLAGFFLRLNPLIERMQSIFLRIFCRFDISEVTEKSPNGESWIRLSKVKSIDSEMAEKIERSCYINTRRNTTRLNIRLQNIIIGHLIERNNVEAEKIMKPWYNFFTLMERLNQDFRNPLAHEIWGITEQEVCDAAGMTCGEIISRLQELTVMLYKKHCKTGVFKIYESLNKKIIEELTRESRNIREI